MRPKIKKLKIALFLLFLLSFAVGVGLRSNKTSNETEKQQNGFVAYLFRT